MTEEQFRILHEEYYKKIVMYAYNRVHDMPLAEDLTTDAFVRVYRLQDGKELSMLEFGNYLLLTVKNLIRNHRKNRTEAEPNHSEQDLKLYFDLEEYAPDEIAEILSLLNMLYQSVGGDGLEIKKMNTLEFYNQLIPA